MDSRIFNDYTYINACNCTRGCTNTVRESALKVDWEKKIPCRPGESNLHQRLADPMLYQLSYIPTHIVRKSNTTASHYKLILQAHIINPRVSGLR